MEDVPVQQQLQLTGLAKRMTGLHDTNNDVHDPALARNNLFDGSAARLC